MLQVDLVAKRARNLSALQKIDGNVLEIVSEASHTALYKFDAASTKWERYAMEGAVFITRNCLAPFYSLIVLNKIGPDDFILDLSTVQKAKIQDSYVMLRYTTGGAPIIMGCWLRDDQEREELLQSVTRAITAGNTNKVSSFPSSLAMKLTAAAQQINNKKVTPVAAPIPTPPASYAAALGIPKQPIPTPTATTTTTANTGASMQVSSSAAAILQAIGNGNITGTGGGSSSIVGGIVSAEGASSGAVGGAGMGLLKLLRAQPTPSTNNNTNSSSNNMAPTTSTSSNSNSGQAFLTDREISAMKTNQHLTHPSHSHQGGSNTGSSTGTNTGSSGSSGSSAMNVVSSSVAVGSTVGVSSKGATSMLLAALQINTTATTTATTAATSTAGIVSASEAVPHTPLSMSHDTKMVPIPLSALLGTILT